MDVTGGAARFWSNLDLPGCVELTLTQGCAAVYSARAPGKEGANEDSAVVIPYPPDGVVLAVADGLGGMPAGAEASRVVLEFLAETLLRDAGEYVALGDALVPAIQAANRALIERARGNATTLALATIEGRLLRTCHVGDSGVLVAGAMGKVKVRTVFHSPTGYAQEAGTLTEQQALKHPSRHIVSNVMGSREMHVELGAQIELADRDTVVIASDGLFDNLYTDEIVEIIGKGGLSAALHTLVTAAGQRMQRWRAGHRNDTPGHPDDLTIIAYRPNGN